MKKNRFDIDFFEFSFLVEACIPPRPIAQSMFWDKVCDEYYHELTKEERKKLFEWIQLNPCFNTDNEDCKLFYDRYNPENQYTVTTVYKGKEETHQCFKRGERYHKSKSVSIQEQYITKVE